VASVGVWLPGLRLILEGKVIPDRYFGSSSVSDNVFDRVYQLIEIGILVEENRVEIIERLRSDSCHQLMKDLYNARSTSKYRSYAPYAFSVVVFLC
jgi:hypothetical protein